MTAEQFAYWLQGFAEDNSELPTPEKWKSIRDHLQTVFVKVTPSVQFPRDLSRTPFPHLDVMRDQFGKWPYGGAPLITC